MSKHKEAFPYGNQHRDGRVLALSTYRARCNRTVWENGHCVSLIESALPFPPSSPKVGPLNNHRVLARTTLIQITTYSIVVDKGAAACRWVKFQCRQLAAHSLASFYLPRHSIHSMRYSSTNSIHTRQPLRRLYNHSTRAPIHFSSFLPLTKYDFLFFSIIFFMNRNLLLTRNWWQRNDEFIFSPSLAFFFYGFPLLRIKFSAPQSRQNEPFGFNRKFPIRQNDDHEEIRK